MTTSAIDIEKIKTADYAHLIHPLFHPSDQKDPFVWVKGEGPVLYSADGKQYLDGLSGLWNVSLGHGRKDLAAAGSTGREAGFPGLLLDQSLLLHGRRR
jgi:adenosylmethionine-8-amino-7-oxononanoate aminotransferase